MQIETPVSTKLVKDFDIAILSGMIMPITVDESMGDTFEELTDRIKVYLAPRPTLDVSDVLPAEHIEIYKTHIVSINHRIRKVTSLTPEQEFLWKQDVQQASGKRVH
jgi:hypothetical protein